MVVVASYFRFHVTHGARLSLPSFEGFRTIAPVFRGWSNGERQDPYAGSCLSMISRQLCLEETLLRSKLWVFLSECGHGFLVRTRGLAVY